MPATANARSWSLQRARAARLFAEVETSHQLVKEALQAFDAETVIDHDGHVIDVRDWVIAARAYLNRIDGK